jgi:zinc protease
MKGKSASTPGVTFIRELGGIREYRLVKNGLQILLLNDADAPVAGCMVTYHVGSRNEAIGYTGATHILEHLMFKGSKHFNKENKSTVWHALEAKGARVNATTWNDRTNYYEVLPREHLPTAIALEADRMRTARIEEKDRESEMTVVRNEYERDENSPTQALDKQLWALAYQAHPYHHPTIGWKSDIEKVSIERLRQFYNDFYWPDNATVTIVGGFDEREVLALIAKEFGQYEARTQPYPQMYTEEPPQEGERRVVVERAGNTDILGVAHKIPGATHEDIPALLILSLVLSDGKTSRLHRALVDSAKATDVIAMCYQFRDPSLFVSYITLAPKSKLADIEKAVKSEYETIIKKGISAPELARAKRSIRSLIASRHDGPYALLAGINEEIATGDWARFVTLPEALARVTVADVKKVAAKYLIDKQSTIGWFRAARNT